MRNPNLDFNLIIDSEASLTAGLQNLIETLAKNAHEVWAKQRTSEGWTYGPHRDDERRRHPCLVPYQDLSESEKEYDRITAIETLKVILKLGFKVVPPNHSARRRKIAENVRRSRLLDQFDSLEISSLLAVWKTRVPADWAPNPELYTRLGEQILRLSEPLLAFDVISEGLRVSPKDVRLRQLSALSLARSGATHLAHNRIKKLIDEGHNDEETLGILARTHKDYSEQALSPSVKIRHLKLAHRFYLRSYRLHRGYYSGINAATLALLLNDPDQAKTLAGEVRQSCLNAVKRLRKNDRAPYWLLATLGEAALMRRRWAEAEGWYYEAAEVARGQFANLASTRRNARLVLQYFGRDATNIDQCFQIPAVVVFTGHRLDRPRQYPPRFPPQLETAVRDALRKRLRRVQAGFGFASAACGSDIIFLEAMIERGLETHVVLPFQERQFLKESVTFLPETNWGTRFRQALKGASEVIIASQRRIADGVSSFGYANLLCQGMAQIKANQLGAELVPMAVWDRQPASEDGGTGSVVEHWRRLGLKVETIDLSRILRENLPALMTGKDPTVKKSPQRKQRSRTNTSLRAILFADAVNFSKLTEKQIPLFMRNFLGSIAELIENSPHAPVIKNTWGDGLYFVFRDVRDAGLLALQLCERLKNIDWLRRGLPKSLSMRIALHAGPVYSCFDPILNQMTYTGTHVSRAARLEPATPSGQVYASREFAALAAAQGVGEFMCDYVGLTPWAKDYGIFPTFHVRPIRDAEA